MATVALRAPTGTWSEKGEAWKRFLARARKASGPKRRFISVRSSCVQKLESDRNWVELERLKNFLKTELDKLDPVLYLTVTEGAIQISHGDVLGE